MKLRIVLMILGAFGFLSAGHAGQARKDSVQNVLENIPGAFASGNWQAAGALHASLTPEGVMIENGILFNDANYADAEYKFRFRVPETSSEVQAWMSFRVKDRHNRYTVGLRGGENNMLYMARYADDANARFLGFAPLEFQPKKGVWYDLRVVTVGKTIQVYFNEEENPRLVITDDTALWTEGGIGIGESYLPAEFSVASVAEIDSEKAKLLAKKSKPKQAYEPWKPSVDKAKLRAENRSSYAPFVLKDISAPRTEALLEGKWLFMPAQELQKDVKPLAMDFDDNNWHTMNVPDMWVPPLAWLHGETGFPYLEEPARGKSAADKLRLGEIKRVLGFTFDWDATNSAWYRHYIELPENINGKRFELKFDAIATISRIFVNGVEVGSHVGMFGEIVCDITKAVKPGKNIIAVEVVRTLPKGKKSSDVISVAESVEITEDMVNSLPKAFYTFSPAGIWQPVRLVVTSPVKVDDIFVKPSLDGAVFDLTVSNAEQKNQGFKVSYKISELASGEELYAGAFSERVLLKPGESKTFSIETSKLSPKLWSPAAPNMYNVEFLLSADDGRKLDSANQKFGFRTIGVEGNRIMLNGKPFWLRGANHYPHAARANDNELAEKFLQMVRDHNVAIGRLHVGPVTEAWAQAADKTGFMLSVEGIWPWLMLKEGVIPSEDLLKAWRNDWAAIVKKYRNHPAIALWTVNNEMKFYIFDRKDKDMLLKKWKIVDEMVRIMREIDPTRPIVADSGYVRNEGNMNDYKNIVQPNNIDDGDIDDVHRYYGWYNESFFHYFDGQIRGLTTPNRPFISQEMSTGYCNEDDGLPSRVYLFNHYTPQALIGDYAFEHNNPKYFLERQSFMTKELGETLRRANRPEMAGVLHFGLVTWMKDSHFAETLAPRIGAKNLKKMLSPVLVSLELFGRHFYAGREITRNLFVVNDCEKFMDLPETTLFWQIKAGENVLADGSLSVPPVKYYENLKLPITMKLPEVNGRVDAKIILTLKAGDKVISENDYEIVIADYAWAGRHTLEFENARMKALNGVVFDPKGTFANVLPKNIAGKIEKMSDIGGAEFLVVADLKAFFEVDGNKDALEKFVKDGGRLIVLNGGQTFADWRKDEITLFRPYKNSRDGGEIVNMKVPESPVFSGIKPMDTAWFADEGSRAVPMACTAVYQINRGNKNVKELAENIRIHGYLNKPSDVLMYSGAPLIEIRDGKGVILASEMRLTAGKDDPIAQRLLYNMITFK